MNNDPVAPSSSIDTPNASSSTRITLLIKSSNQQFQDLVIDCDLMWTVKHVKIHISDNYPHKPSVGEQKLIYSGQLLNDSLLLKDVIRNYKDVHTQNHVIHLVLTPKNSTPLKAEVNVSARTSSQAHIRNSFRSAPPTIIETSNTDSANGETTAAAIAQPQLNPLTPLQQYPLPPVIPYGFSPNQISMMASTALFQQMQFLQNAQAQNMPPHLAAYGLAAQQAVIYNSWMRQVYAHYMDNMVRFISIQENIDPNELYNHCLHTAQVDTILRNDFSLPSMPTVRSANEGPHSMQAHSIQAQAIRAEEAPRQNPVFHHQGVENEPEGNRENWFNSLYSVIRFVFILSILFVNISPLRLLFVTIIGGIFYLYHIGLIHIRPEYYNNIRPNNNNNNVVQPQPQQQPVPMEQHQRNEFLADVLDEAIRVGNLDVYDPEHNDRIILAGEINSDGPIDISSVEPEPVAAPANVSWFSIVRTFVVTFFISMLPEAPPAI